MRKPDSVEHLYLDFDGFFASVEQQTKPALRNRPIGVVPFPDTEHTCVIACSKEAKQRGVKNVMRIRDAKEICPELVLVPQSPDLYRRAHNALLSEIRAILPIEAIKSIDEVSCRLDKQARKQPEMIANAIKSRLRTHIGPYITCSIGFAANRQLAKIACKINKPDGMTIWHPEDMPAPLLDIPLSDVPGIGKRMEMRLWRAGIHDMPRLLATEPKQMRLLWRNVTGERLWYALHGYDIHASGSNRAMFGHGRVLPPGYRSLEQAQSYSRLLLVKAARRLRRAGFYAGRLWLWLKMRERGWHNDIHLPCVHDDQACLSALHLLWQKAQAELLPHTQIIRMGVALYNLFPSHIRQLDMFLNDDAERQKWETITHATDHLNSRYGHTVISLGPWIPPPGGYAGGKISYTRIPKAEDFW